MNPRAQKFQTNLFPTCLRNLKGYLKYKQTHMVGSDERPELPQKLPFHGEGVPEYWKTPKNIAAVTSRLINLSQMIELKVNLITPRDYAARI